MFIVYLLYSNSSCPLKKIFQRTLEKTKFLWRPTRHSRTNTQNSGPFNHMGLECKSRKSRDTWSNRQIGLGIRNEAGQRLTELCQENALVIANTLFRQHKRWLQTWTLPDGQYPNQIDYILCNQKWRNSIQPAKQDQELAVTQIMKSLLQNSDLNWRK